MTSLLDLLERDGRPGGRIYGVVTAVVTDNQDPDKLGRVKVRFPGLSESEESWWARVATPGAGNARGAGAGNARGVFFLPDVDDEVLVAFEHGDVGRLYVIGALWSEEAKPPASNEDGRNDIRMIRSRSGHVIRFNDAEGAERIEIVGKSQKNSIVIDAAANTIAISADADITIKSSSGTLRLKARGVEIESTADVTIQARGETTVKGTVVNIN